MSQYHIGGLEQKMWPFNKKETNSTQETLEDPSRREFIKTGIALAGAHLLGMNSKEVSAGTTYKGLSENQIINFSKRRRKVPNEELELAEAITKLNNDDLEAAWYWFKVRDYHIRHRLSNPLSQGIREMYQFAQDKLFSQKILYSEPTFHWTAIRFCNDEYRTKLRKDRKLKQSIESNQALNYLTQGMEAYSSKLYYGKRLNYQEMERNLITSMFISSNYPDELAKKMDLETSGVNIIEKSINYTTQFQKASELTKKKILLTLPIAFNKISDKTTLKIGHWNSFLLVQGLWNLANSRDPPEFALYINRILEKGYFREKRKLPKIRGPPGNILD